ncbi:MAG TPA: tetratricopeptide repeat protein [Pyrinomonadaceae bacterium]|nr:tetratricopeptide repeat protein [Pyrinomonadaceae bacterium]
MNLKECPRARRVRALLAVLLVSVVAFAAGCSNPEKAKAEHLRRGEAFLKERRWQEASLEFRNAIQIDDNLAAAHWGLAQSYEQLGRVSEYFEELQRTIKLDPNNTAARLKLANGYLFGYARDKNQEYLAEAERLANEILARDAKNPDGHILLANVTYFKGGPDAAKQAEEKINYAISLDPQRVESHLGLARLYLQMNRTSDAEAVYKKAITVNDRSSLVHVEYGKFLTQSKRVDEAEAEFRKAAEVDPENRDVAWVLASYYLVNNKLDKAEEAYKAWAKLDWDKPEGKARLADFYATVGRFDEAASLYQEIIKAAPDYARGHYRLGEISLQRGDTAGASAQVEDLLKRSAKDVDALFLRARMRVAAGKLKDAIGDLKAVLDQEPRSRLGLYFMADALYRDGQYEQARGRAGELERYYQDFLPAKLLQIQINLDSGDYATAKRMADDLLNRLKETAPNGEQTPQLLADVKNNALILRGKASLRLGQQASGADVAKNIAAARSDFEAARSTMPNSPLVYVNLADVAAAENKADEAQQQLERALSIDRTNFQALSALINLGAATRQLDAVRARIEQLAAEQPNNAQLHYLLGQAYRTGNAVQQPDAARAEAAFQRAIQLDPDYMSAYSALAEVYFGMQQPDRAIGEYKKITERRPDDFIAYRNIGLIEAGRGQHDVAAEYYRRVLSIRPDEPVAANNLAALYADHGKGNAEEAMRLAQDVVRRFPAEPGFADTLGWVYYRKGLYRDAIEQLQRAVAGAAKRGGDNSLYRWHLGAALAANGDKAAARRELQKCLELSAQEQQRSFKPPTQTPIDDVRRTLESL